MMVFCSLGDTFITAVPGMQISVTQTVICVGICVQITVWSLTRGLIAQDTAGPAQTRSGTGGEGLMGCPFMICYNHCDIGFDTLWAGFVTQMCSGARPCSVPGQALHPAHGYWVQGTHP